VVPTKKSQTFTTYQDQQTTVSIQVSACVPQTFICSAVGLISVACRLGSKSYLNRANGVADRNSNFRAFADLFSRL